MSESYGIYIGDERHEIEVKPITLIVPSADMNYRIKYPGKFPLDQNACLSHLKTLHCCHADTERFFRMVFKDYERDFDLDWIRNCDGSGVQHVVGRFDFTLKALDIGLDFVWIYPEGSLHPRTQCNLADATVVMMQRGAKKYPPPIGRGAAPWGF